MGCGTSKALYPAVNPSIVSETPKPPKFVHPNSKNSLTNDKFKEFMKQMSNFQQTDGGYCYSKIPVKIGRTPYCVAIKAEKNQIVYLQTALQEIELLTDSCCGKNEKCVAVFATSDARTKYITKETLLNCLVSNAELTENMDSLNCLVRKVATMCHGLITNHSQFPALLCNMELYRNSSSKAEYWEDQWNNCVAKTSNGNQEEDKPIFSSGRNWDSCIAFLTGGTVDIWRNYQYFSPGGIFHAQKYLTDIELYTRSGSPFDTSLPDSGLAWETYDNTIGPMSSVTKSHPVTLFSKRKRVKEFLEMKCSDEKEALYHPLWTFYLVGRDSSRKKWEEHAPGEALEKQGECWYPKRLWQKLAGTKFYCRYKLLPPICPTDKEEADEILSNIDDMEFVEMLAKHSVKLKKKKLRLARRNADRLLRRLSSIEDCESKLEELSSNEDFKTPHNPKSNMKAIFTKWGLGCSTEWTQDVAIVETEEKESNSVTEAGTANAQAVLAKKVFVYMSASRTWHSTELLDDLKNWGFDVSCIYDFGMRDDDIKREIQKRQVFIPILTEDYDLKVNDNSLELQFNYAVELKKIIVPIFYGKEYVPTGRIASTISELKKFDFFRTGRANTLKDKLLYEQVLDELIEHVTEVAAKSIEPLS